MTKRHPVSFRVHTPQLLNRILEIPAPGVLGVPLNVFGKLLYAVAERASQINDAELNKLMCDLTLYSVADPEVPEFDPAMLKRVDRAARKARKERLANG